MSKQQTLRGRRKPDFQSMGEICDTQYLSKELRSDLRKHLDRRWSDSTKDEFLRLLEGSVGIARVFWNEKSQDEKFRALDAVQSAAHALLIAIEGLHGHEAKEDLETSSPLVALVHGGFPPLVLSNATRNIANAGSVVNGWWDVVYDIERATNYAAQKVVKSKGLRQKQQNARRLVRAAADAVNGATGSLPKTSKGTWFPEFARVLCDKFDVLPCGRELVSKVVKDMQPTG